MSFSGSKTIQYRYDFLKYRSIGYALSAALLVIGLVTYFVKGFQYNISFTGGAEMRLAFEKPLDIAQLRSSIGSLVELQEIGTQKREFLVRAAKPESDLETTIVGILARDLPDNKVSVEDIKWVGPEVGKDTQWNAVKAVLISLLVLLLYIAVRFEFRFGVGAVAALLHDVLMILVFLLVAGEQVSLHVLAALLAVLGYSLNDTIVIFSKVRENMKKLRGVSEYDIVNLSINQTLRRTILTSLSTFLAVMSIVLLGGESLRGLSLVMCLGVIVGTYSSIYIAGAVMLGIGKLSAQS